MKYALYQATDLRDNRQLLWLHDKENHRVATFCTKWALSRIKHRTATAPDGIIWEPEDILTNYAALPSAHHIESWG